MREQVQAIAPTAPNESGRTISQVEYRAMWDAYERSSATHKSRAERARDALAAFHEMVDNGASIAAAESAIVSAHGVSKVTLWRYRNSTKGHAPCNWLPLLSPRYSGGRPPAEFTPEAYQYILGKYLNTSETPLTVVLKAARDMAPLKSWAIPSHKAVLARLAKEPEWMHTLGRKGPKALERSYRRAQRTGEAGTCACKRR